MTTTRTVYRLEVRPLTVSPFKRVLIYNAVKGTYEKYALKRGKWFTAFRRTSDGRAVFSQEPGSGTVRLNDLGWAKNTASRYKKLGFATNIIPVQIELYPHLSGDLDGNANVLEALENTAKDLKQNIWVASGKRTRAEQEHLYSLYLAGKGNLAARPGTSRHETGRAADSWVNGTALRDYPRGKATATKHGLTFPVASEGWHVER